MKIGIFDSSWDYTINTPYEMPLGGTQSAICYFLEEMKIRGHEVYLFNKTNIIMQVRGIPHIPATSYLKYISDNALNFDLIIVSCIVQQILELKLTLSNPTTLYCLWTGHDIDQVPSKILKDEKVKEMIDLFLFVSDWQRIRYIEEYKIKYQKTLILRNGIGKPFEKYLNMSTNKIKNSMTYCSIPWRGLDLLAPIFKEIKEKHDDATLNIYSGMNIYHQTENTGLYDDFKEIKSVNCSYGISQTKLAEELYKIEYLTYPNIFPETSCITVLQAMAVGCLVITSNLGALMETMGNLNDYIEINIHNFDKKQYIHNFTNTLNNNIILSDKMKEMMREQNRRHIKKNYTWNIICEKFETDINLLYPTFKKYIELEYSKSINTFIQTFAQNKWLESLILSNQMIYYPSLNDYYVIKLNEGVSYFQLNKIENAKACFKICKQIKNDSTINKNLALLEIQQNDLIKFVKYARESLGFNFECEFANLLAEKYELLGYYNDAIALYEVICKLDSNNINAPNNLGNLYLLGISQLEDINKTMDDTYGKAFRLSILYDQPRKKELILSNMIFNNLYNWQLSNEEIFKKSCEWYKYFPKLPELKMISDKLNRNKISNTIRKIKIGYISCDFITHPVGFMFDSILKNHDLSSFEIFCYDCCDLNKRIDDHMSKKLRSYNNAIWHDFSSISDSDGLTVLINDDLDILVDMMGHTRNTRMNLLQYKPARILISYFAYPSTNGLNEIDYRFTDKYATPPEIQKYYVEKLYCLPNGFQCYTPPVDIESIKNYTRDKYKIHLCCFNNPSKLSIPTIETFVEILKQLPEAKLFLRYCYYKSSYFCETIIKLFTDRNINKDRLDIGYVPLIEALQLYNNMDIVLDPFPYNGGTISSEAIYMNTPFITLEGETYVSRVGVSLLSNLGLQKYIAKTKDEYIQKVVNLAKNDSELKLLHQTLRHRMLNSDLANSVTFTKNIEIAYKDIVNKFNK
jgi:protein O-GlcNAc transferase